VSLSTAFDFSEAFVGPEFSSWIGRIVLKSDICMYVERRVSIVKVDKSRVRLD